MQFLKVILLFLFVVSTKVILPQIYPGAKQAALNNSGVAQPIDVFSIYKNAALLPLLNKQIGVYYSPAPFGLKELGRSFIGYSHPLNDVAFGVIGKSYGFELYKEYEISLAAGYLHNDVFSIGASFNFNDLSIKNYGSKNTLSLDGGLLLFLPYNIRYGISFKNFTNSSYVDTDEITSLFSTGLNWSNPDFNFNLELEKRINRKSNILLGIDYRVLDFLFLRAGTSTSPKLYSGGIGFCYKNISFDYAISSHELLGLTHQVGLIISLND